MDHQEKMYLPNSNLKIPSTTYSHTTRIGIPETSTNIPAGLKGVTIEIEVEGFYKLYVEPFKGHPFVTLDEDYIVSPKFTYKFNLPLFILSATIAVPLCKSRVLQELGKLPMSSGLATYLHPHIVQEIVTLAQTNPNAEFKIIFYVKVVTNELADYNDCDGYRKRGIV